MIAPQSRSSSGEWGRLKGSLAVVVGALVSLGGCTRSHVAAFADATDGGSSQASSESVEGSADTTSVSMSATTASSDATATMSDPSTGTETDTGAATCRLPARLPDCDVAADPLRALEVACFDDVSAAEFRSEDEDAWRRVHEFGNSFWVSEDSEAVLVLSTGRLPEPNSAGQVELAEGAAELEAVDNDNPDETALPEPIVIAPGSATPYEDCDGVGDCSHTLAGALAPGGAVSDLVWLRFSAKVPDGVRGYSVQVGFLSAEYPERLGADDNSAFIWWSTSETYTGNLATWGGEAATVTGLAERLSAFEGGHPILTRTGFDGQSGMPCPGGEPAGSCSVGATTGWMTLRGPAVPGETLEVAVALFEQSAAATPETVVVLDDWQWSCNPCTPGVSCGLQ